jgi:uncharacterized protein
MMRYTWLAIGLALFILKGAVPAHAQEPAPRGRSIEVHGEAMAEGTPDQAIITIGVNNRGDDPSSAMNANSASIRRIISMIEAAGINKNDIRTSRVNLSQNASNNRFEAGNMVTLRVRALDKLDHLLADLLKNGVNTIQGISFVSSESSKLARDLRIAAIRDAREKAESLAQAAGASLGEILTITYGGASHSSPVSVMRAGAAAPMRDVPIEPGSITLREEVFTIWQLK